MLNLTIFKSPLGWVAILAHETAIYFVSAPRRTRAEALRSASASSPRLVRSLSALGELAKARLTDYFIEPRHALFDDLPLDWSRGTEFERRVWKTLLSIPIGETRTYVEIARALGISDGARAIGNSNRKNPWSIIVPCHRVIGASGSLVGYAGGLETKAKLLMGEGVAITLPQRRGAFRTIG